MTKAERSIKKSINKWQGIVDGKIGDNGMQNCQLCRDFYYKKKNGITLWHEPNCVGCPVADAAGDVHCARTPYGDWSIHWIDCHEEEVGEFPHNSKVECPTCKELAKAELDFLTDVYNKLKEKS